MFISKNCDRTNRLVPQPQTTYNGVSTDVILPTFPFLVKDDIMERVETRLKWSDERFKRSIGTTKPVFRAMLEILQAGYNKKHELGGYRDFAKPPFTTQSVDFPLDANAQNRYASRWYYFL